MLDSLLDSNENCNLFVASTKNKKIWVNDHNSQVYFIRLSMGQFPLSSRSQNLCHYDLTLDENSGC
jgi:hypothetical protein